MNTYIIFTRVDDRTLKYFKKFFPGQKIEQEEFTSLHFKADETTPQIFFVNDMRECDLDIALIDKKNIVYVYYHISSTYYAQHRDYIITHLPLCFEYKKSNIPVPGDHHNEDGYHYRFVLKAANKIAKNDIKGYAAAINHLSNKS